MERDAAYTYEKDVQKSTLRKEKAKMGTKKKKKKIDEGKNIED